MQETYRQDEHGVWWCYGKRQRSRALRLVCAQCKREFCSRHPQQFCSKKCNGKSQRGYRGELLSCAWCKKKFERTRRTARRICCSARCVYDLGNSKRGRKGPANGRWKGGINTSHPHGYVREWASGRGYMLQHRLVMERTLGRRLLPSENVHHKNGIRDDNRPENLELWKKHQPPGQRAHEQKHCETCTCFA